MRKNCEDYMVLSCVGFGRGHPVGTFTADEFEGFIDFYYRDALGEEQFSAILSRLVAHGWVVVRKDRYVASDKAMALRKACKRRLGDWLGLRNDTDSRFEGEFFRQNGAHYETERT